MQSNNIKSVKTLYVKLMFFLIISIIFAGCKENDASSNNPDYIPNQSLRIHLKSDLDSQWYNSFTSAELSGNFTEGLDYRNVKDVTIEINGQDLQLEEALQCNLITENEILFYARQDAKKGICQEISESKHGLTNFTYLYPAFDLRIIYDVLESPDGQQHLISHMTISPPSGSGSPYYDFRDSNNNRYIIEDWGLNFEINAASSTGIQLTCTQAAGQQLGQLYLSYYEIDSNGEALMRIDDNEYWAIEFEDILITTGETTEITFDWTEAYGELPSGDYTLILAVEDVFEESQVHPLMVDYYDFWLYSVEFTIE